VITPDHPPPAVEALAATIINWAGPRDRQG
jgi:hypothetical protein